MFWLTTSWMPAAVSSTGRPSPSATDRSAASFGGEVERHVAAEEVAGVEQAESTSASVTAGSCAAAAVARRPGVGARRFRADLQQAELVDAGEAAAAGADLDEVDRRHRHRESPSPS